MSVFETEYETQGFLGETGEYEGQGFLGETGEYEGQGFLGGLLGSVLGGEVGETESFLGESTEMELATELLEVQSEEELEQFLGKLISGVAKKVGGFMKSSTGRALGGVLKGIAKKALPVVGGALGSVVAPGIGTALGSKLGSLASGLFEVELEGLNEEEAEFEVARRFVRLASTAARHAAVAPPQAPPRAVARAAVVTAARRHAPGLVRGTRYAGKPGVRRPGTTFRGRRPPVSAVGRPRYGTPRRPGPGMRWYGGPAYAYPVEAGYPEPGYEPDEDMDGYGAYPASTVPRSGRWIRRGRKIVLFGL